MNNNYELYCYSFVNSVSFSFSTFDNALNSLVGMGFRFLNTDFKFYKDLICVYILKGSKPLFYYDFESGYYYLNEKEI